MAYTTINKSTDYFNTKIYTGNESAGHAITGVGFQPDFTWFKNRGGTDSHSMYDAVRGVTKQIESDTTGAETTESTGLASFDSDGFTVGTRTASNSNNMSICSWNWKANGQGSANNDGSTNTTYTSANTTAGISIVKWTPSGSAETVGHGLGAVPKMIITKNLGASQGWFTYHHSIGNTKYLLLNTTAAEATDSNAWNNTTPTSSVFSVGSQFAGSDYVAYCFAEKTGFSKFGKYTGNGNDDGTFVYTGFRPAFVLLKNTTTDGEWWVINDSGRNPNNIVDKDLFSNNSNVEAVHSRQDFVSNGFKFKSTANNSNKNGDIYVYMAFAEAPLVGTNNIPCTAR
jgi:hypothetical protein